jgi:transketolase
MIIAQTVKGRWISFAENVVGFHNSALTVEQFQVALRELEEQLSLINQEVS